LAPQANRIIWTALIRLSTLFYTEIVFSKYRKINKYKRSARPDPSTTFPAVAYSYGGRSRAIGQKINLQNQSQSARPEGSALART